ncbi:unnamed protein product [Rotaria magnacalcarata]|uniref:RUN domain-containing protein n=3 Tax=Rotaria magnacalcarata TaxID=392030 RepID=A0A816TFM3_9BILA|nr:unnamed protein product [Rotaria magnacalcarata]CAF2122089.1 unnamed protein product [Rotaria magnacalcarata]CAF3762319.1 unnamed protein product [Rotaria magnacalcarata]CAF3784407.1 unnamed protein product [Rotaria magnacalcarata]
MYNQNCGTTLVSQLLDSINDRLKTVHSPMEQQVQNQLPEYEMSVDNPDDDELWLSGHRSIFSSYGSYCRKTAPPLRDSQYEGFHWDLYEDRNYHHLAFEHEHHDAPPACQAASLSEWSMRLSSGGIGGGGDTEDDADVEGDDTTSLSDPPRTSWHAIKSKSVHQSCSSSAHTSDGSEHRSRSPLTLYRLFQRTRSQQHPCRLYQNFSDKSMCDSLTSSSSCSNLNKFNEPTKKEHKIPMPRFKLKSPTTFSQLKLNKSSSHNDFLSSIEQLSSESKEQQFKASNQATIPRRSVDQCLQTSLHIDNTSSLQPQSTRRYISRSTSRPLDSNNHCLQTDTVSVTRSKSVDRSLSSETKNANSNNPSQTSTFPSSTAYRSLPTILSLPDLSFLTYYAKENPAPPPATPSSSISTNQTKQFCSRMKSALSEPSSLTKKVTRTVFYCSIKVPSVSSNPMRPTTLHPPMSTMQRPRTLREIKRIKSIKTSPTTMGNMPLRTMPMSPSAQTNNVDHHIKEEENATFSLTCSSTSTSANSTSSSGYCSNSSTNHPRQIQTPTSSYPLKSCLKRAKTEDLTSTPLTPTSTVQTTAANVLAVGAAGDIFTLAARTLAACLPDHIIETSRHRRYSAPSLSSHQNNFSIQLQTRQKGCTLSEHDLRAKKSVSFCDDIARRLITPSASPKHRPTPPPSASFRYDRGYCDLVPRESLTDSPPSEFNLSEDEHEDSNESNLINFTENAPVEITKPLPVKYGSDKYLIDAFSNTVLHVLEIKCSDPQSYYLNNLTNRELDRTLRLDLCPLLREVLEDGLRQYGGSLFSKKINLWRLIDFTTPKTGRFNDAKVKAQLGLSSTVDWIEKFNAFIYHLLNLHELAAWLAHFLSHRAMLTAYYESWAFILVHVDNDLFERITNQLEKLSPLPFRLKYTHSSNAITPTKTTTTTTTTTTNQRPSSLLPKRFNVRAWLRDRKTQVKISPKEPVASSSSCTSSIRKSPSASTIPSQKSTSSVPTKPSSTVPLVQPSAPPNTSLRRKLGSIPVPKRQQTVR